MLTGKKIGLFFITSIFLVSIIFVFYPKEAAAAYSASRYNLTSQNISNGPSSVGSGGVLEPYTLEYVHTNYNLNDKVVNTAELGPDVGNGKGSEYYSITDGKTAAIYKKGVVDSINNPNRDTSKDTLIGIGDMKTGQYRALKTPVTLTNTSAVRDAINSAATLAGNPSTYDAYSTLSAVDDSLTTTKKEQDEARALQTEIQDLEKEVRDGTITPEEQQRLEELYEMVDPVVQSTITRGGTVSADTRADASRPTPAPPDKIYCLDFFTPGVPTVNWSGCAAIVGNWMLSVAAFLLWAVALLFDYTLGITLNFKELVIDQIGVIEIGWKIFRDISNIFFIFLLLAAAIGTIVNSGSFNAKSMIPKILVAAILINFSLFITKAIVDVSNIMALQFYAHMGGPTDPDLSTLFNTSDGKATGIAAVFLDSMNLQSLYTMSTTDVANASQGAAGTEANTAGISLNAANIALVGIFGTILFIVTSFVMLAAIFLFMARTLILIFLMTTAPVAFMAYAVPSGNLRNLNNQWWTLLWKQVFFAPVYMAMMYISVMAVKNLASVGIKGSSFAAMFNGVSGSINILFTFAMIIGFMVLSLVTAVKIGATGSNVAMSGMKKMRGYGMTALKASTLGVAAVGSRRVIGGTATYLSNSEKAKNFLSRVPLGNTAMRGLMSVSKQKFGTKKSYEDVIKDRADRDSATAKQFETVNQDYFKMKSGETYTAYQARLAAAEKSASERADKSLGIKRIMQPKKDKDGEVVKDKKTGEVVMEEVGATMSTGFFSNPTRATRAGHNRAQQARLKKKVDDVKKKTTADKRSSDKTAKIQSELDRKKEKLEEAVAEKEAANAEFISKDKSSAEFDARKTDYEATVANVERLKQEIANLENQKAKVDEENELLEALKEGMSKGSKSEGGESKKEDKK